MRYEHFKRCGNVAGEFNYDGGVVVAVIYSFFLFAFMCFEFLIGIFQFSQFFF